MMNRRGFLGAILVAGAAPAIVRASSIMRIRPIVLPGDAEFAMIQPMTATEVEMRVAAYLKECGDIIARACGIPRVCFDLKEMESRAT